MDVELQKGTITPADIAPGTSATAAIPGKAGAKSRRALRNRLSAPTTLEGPALEQLRKMRGAVADAQIKRPDVALGLPPGKNLRIVRDPSQLRTTALQFESAEPATSLTLRNTRQRGEMYLPEMDEYELKKINKNKTLRRAAQLPTLQHELGEFQQYLGKELTPFASHVGTIPNVREKLVALGDKDLQKELKTLRAWHPDDVLFEKLYKQVGGTPDAPIPLGGRQQKALDKLIARNSDKLSTEAKLFALHHASGKNMADKGKYAVPYLNKAMVAEYDAMAPSINRYIASQLQKPNAPVGTAGTRAWGARQAAKRTSVERKLSPTLRKFLGLRNKSQLGKLLRM